MAIMGGSSGAYRVLVGGKVRGRDHLEELGVDER